MSNFRMLLLLLAMGLVLSSGTCQEKKQTNECEGVMCTMMFAMVTAEVRNADGTPAGLDSTVTIAENGSTIPTSPGNTSAGMYTIVDDGYQKPLANKMEKVKFKGYRNGAMVVDQDYTVKADCCHVSKVSGPAVVSLK
jgi:hypothetical protein